MKNRFWTIISCCLLALPAMGQVVGDDIGGGRVGSKVQAARVAYITERLGLTPNESERFWALYNEFENEKEKIQNRYSVERPLGSLSDEEAEAYILRRFKMEEELLELKKSYYPRFTKVISPRRIALFQKADKEFRLELLRKVRQRQPGNSNRPFRPGN